MVGGQQADTDKKTKSMLIGSRQALKKAKNIEIFLDNEKLDEVSTFDYRGLRASNILSWDYRVNRSCQRMYPKFCLLNQLSLFLPSSVLLRIYKQTVLPVLEYGSMHPRHAQ